MDRWHAKLLRFMLVGVLATVVHTLVVILGHRYFGLGQSAANGSAFVVASAVSYWVNTHWSFGAAVTARTALRFFFVAGCGFVWSCGLGALADAMGWHYLLGVALIVCTLPPLSFVAHNSWTYAAHETHKRPG